MDHLSNLPKDIRFYIYKFLSIIDYGRLVCVNKLFYNEVNPLTLIKRPKLRKNKPYSLFEMIILLDSLTPYIVLFDYDKMQIKYITINELIPIFDNDQYLLCDLNKKSNKKFIICDNIQYILINHKIEALLDKYMYKVKLLGVIECQ